MDFQPEFQAIFSSTINDTDDNFVVMGELFESGPDLREGFKLIRKFFYEKWNRSNQIIQNQSETLISLNKVNHELTKEIIYLRERVRELENQKISKTVSHNHYESLQTPVTSRNLNDENSDPDIVLDLNNQVHSKSICKSVSSPAIMSNVKNKEENRFKKEFRFFNTKVSISHAKRLHKENDNYPLSNDNEKKTLDRMDTRSSLINLFKKPKKELKQKTKRLSSSMNENLRVYDEET